MPRENLRPKTYDRFNSVESVATEIFQNMPGLDPSGSVAEQAETITANEDASNVVSLFGNANGDAGTVRTQSERLWDALVFAVQ